MRVTHATVAGATDSNDGKLSSNAWNQSHVLQGTANMLVGFDGNGNGAEIDPSTVTGAVSVKSFGATGDGATDDTAAIQAAIDSVADTGGALTFPRGTYNHTGLVFKNKVQYRGSGRDASATNGTVLHYTGTGDGVQINNPINSSTSANISIEGITFKNATVNAGKGCLADTGSTDLKIRHCAFVGADRLLILDQSELVDVTECDFEISAASSTCGLWIVNGADRSVGATAGFTNRISVRGCQFNGTATVYGIVDDGGGCHSFIDNNYNACLHQIRAAGVAALRIAGGEFESSAAACIRFESTSLLGTSVGQCNNAHLEAAVLVPINGQNCIICFSMGTIILENLFFGNTSAVKFNGAVNCASLIALGCLNGGGGVSFDSTGTKQFQIEPTGGVTSNHAHTCASLAINGGTALTKTAVYTPTLTPSSVAAQTVAEQTYTVSGLTTADKVIVNPPAISNATGIAGVRVSAADTLAIRWVNPTAGALTPTSGTYTVLALRS